MSEQIYTVPEVASRFRVCDATIYRHFNEGRFPGAFRVGRKVRITEEAIEAYKAGPIVDDPHAFQPRTARAQANRSAASRRRAA